MIRHSALFRLNHDAASVAETNFLRKLSELRSIPGVDEFQIVREISSKNPFTFAVSMEFADQLAYDAYNSHPLHVAFVSETWIPEVVEFMEHDTVSMVLEK